MAKPENVHNAAVPWLLYRYILVELLRVVGLTTAVLVTVIAFGALIKPLTNDRLLSASQTLKYLGLAIIPMLQYALPFAAGFAATSSLHRITADNELQAMAVSGISYRRVLMPVLALALALGVVMVALTQWVIPRFWGLIEQTIATDATKLFQTSIERQTPFQVMDQNKHNKHQIFADKLIPVPNPPDTDADMRFILYGVVAAELDDDGQVATESTARQAVADIYRDNNQTRIQLVMTDAVVYNPSDGQLATAPRLELPQPIVVPSRLNEGTRTMTRGQLLRLRSNPDQFPKVVGLKDELAAALRDSLALKALDQRLADEGRAEFIELGSQQRRYQVYADRLSGDRLRYRDGRLVEIVQFNESGPMRRCRAPHAVLARARAAQAGAAAFDLVMPDAEVADFRSGAPPNQRQRVALLNLQIVGFEGPEMNISADLPSGALIEQAAKIKGKELADDVEALSNEIISLHREINSRLMNRYALSFTAVLLLLLGAVLAMWLRDGTPLVIYVWAFVPSVLDLILISGGEQMMRDGRWFALPIMWSGNTVLFLMLIFVYLKLKRH